MIELDGYELEVLINWHQEQKCKFAENEQYCDADYHKKKANELRIHLNIQKAENIVAATAWDKIIDRKSNGNS
jgi:hypothetical protein